MDNLRIKNINTRRINIRNKILSAIKYILHLILNKNRGKHNSKYLWNYRQHNKSLSYKKRGEIINYGSKIFKKYSLGNFSTNNNHPYKLKI